MCQLVRFRTDDAAAFWRRLADIPADVWVNVYEDRTTGGEADQGERMWATLAAVDAMREHGHAVEALARLEAELIPVFYGPGATVYAKLMAADLRACVAARGGIGAVRVGEGDVGEAARSLDVEQERLFVWQPQFSPPYVWQLVRTPHEAVEAVRRAYPGDREALAWAESFQLKSPDDLLSRAVPAAATSGPASRTPSPR